MKIQFKATRTLKNKTTTESPLSKVVLNNARDLISPEIAMSEFFETAKNFNALDSEFKPTLEVHSIKAKTLIWSMLPKSLEGQFFENTALHFEYTMNYELVSIPYECLQFFPENGFLLVEPKTDRLFYYQLPKEVEAFKYSTGFDVTSSKK